MNQEEVALVDKILPIIDDASETNRRIAELNRRVNTNHNNLENVKIALKRLVGANIQSRMIRGDKITVLVRWQHENTITLQAFDNISGEEVKI